MKIDRIRTFMSRDANRPRVIVAIDTDAGVTGWGECYNHGPDRALPAVIDHIALQITGHDPTRVEYIVHRLLQEARFPPGTLVLAAISAIDHALWDISAKALGVPVYQLLGGRVRDKVKVYCGIYTAPDPLEALDLCQSLNDSYGFAAFKLSPYRVDIHARRWGEVLKTSADYFGKLREISPSHFDYAFDAHAKIYEPWQAVQLGNALAPWDPLFYEEPFRPEHVEAWGPAKAQMRVPLATGESLFNRWEFLRLMQVRGCDIAQPDICVVGGITEMRRIAAVCDAHYVPIAPHNPMGPLATAVNLHFCAALTNFKILEYRVPADAPYVKDPYLPVDGYLELRPDRPGWGVEMDEDFLARDEYVHWERKLPIRPDGSTGYV
jgi:galactonate dehydratase